MKSLKIALSISFFLFIGLFFTGCASFRAYPVEYSFALDGQKPCTIGFQRTNRPNSPSVSFISIDGRRLPRPEPQTYWDPLIFPSERELRIHVRATYEEENIRLSGTGLVSKVVNTVAEINEMGRSVDMQVIFICPPLAPDGAYQLSFIKGTGVPGKNTLVLIDLFTGKPVVEQEFELTFRGIMNTR